MRDLTTYTLYACIYTHAYIPPHLLIRILQFARHKVQVVPPSEGKQTRVEGETQAGRVVLARPWILKVVHVACEDLCILLFTQRKLLNNILTENQVV